MSESVTGRWSCFVGHASLLSTCLVYSPTLCPPGMKEIEQDATVPGAGSRYVDGRPSQRNYVTAFQVADRPPVDDSQLCAINVNNGPCTVQLVECTPLSDYYAGIFQETPPRTL